jgi:hypothetical protein
MLALKGFLSRIGLGSYREVGCCYSTFLRRKVGPELDHAQLEHWRRIENALADDEVQMLGV